MGNNTDLHDRSVLEKLLRIDKQTAQVMALDMLTAGVDTVSARFWFFKTILIALSSTNKISFLSDKLNDNKIVLIKTRNFSYFFENVKMIPCISSTPISLLLYILILYI